MTKVKIREAVERAREHQRDADEHFEHFHLKTGFLRLDRDDLRTILAALKRSNEALEECASSYETAMEVDADHLDLETCAELRDTAEAALSDEIEV